MRFPALSVSAAEGVFPGLRHGIAHIYRWLIRMRNLHFFTMNTVPMEEQSWIIRMIAVMETASVTNASAKPNGPGEH